MLVENILIPSSNDTEICGMTRIGASGMEWICIREPHKRVYRYREGGGIYQHYMVNRWPYLNL